MNNRQNQLATNLTKETSTYRQILINRRRLKYSKDDSKTQKRVPHIGECLLSGLETLWRHKQMTDIVVVAENRTYLAHKLVLASCSDYFYEKFTRGREAEAVRIEVQDVKASALEAILECMYTGKLQLTEVNVREILSAASTLGFLGVREACEEYLNEHLVIDNCLKMLDMSLTYDLEHLYEASSALAAKEFEKVSRKPDYKYVPVEQLLGLLTRDDLQTKNELVVFDRVLNWIEVDRQRRMEFTADLLETVRLPLLSPSEIVDRVESVSFLMDIPDCQKLVKEALHYHCMPARQTLLQTARTVPRAPVHYDCLVATGGAPRYKTEPVCNEVSALNEAQGTWEVVARLPEARHHHAVAVMYGFLYVVGGEMKNDHCSPVNTAHRFDPRTSTWLQIASMKYRRESFQLGVLHGKLYAVGGRVNKTESLSSVERYNASTDEWEEVAPISVAKRSVAVAVMHGRLYAAGGSGTKFVSSRVERYHPSENKWEIRSSLLTPRFFAHLRNIGGVLYLIGGATINEDGEVICADTIEQYKPDTDTWTVATNMKCPRAEFGSSLIGDRIFIVGGYDWNKKERLSSVESFSVSKSAWEECPSLSKSYTGLACVTMTLYGLDRHEVNTP